MNKNISKLIMSEYAHDEEVERMGLLREGMQLVDSIVFITEYCKKNTCDECFLSQNNLFRCLLKYPPNEWHDRLTERAFLVKTLLKESEEETDETETDENPS